MSVGSARARVIRAVGARRRAGPTVTAGLAVATGLVLALVAGCGSGGTAAPPAPGTPGAAPSGAPGRTLTVVASTNVWADVVSKVAGPDVQVHPIITDPNADPHSYESTPADAAAIGSADLVVYNGGGYDDFVDKALDASPGARDKSIAAFTLRSDPSSDNEHVWFDTATVTQVARQIAMRLGQAEPAQAAALSQRADAFSAQVTQVGQRFAAIGQARPGLTGLSSEPVPFYLERAAGITDATPGEFSEAIEGESDPPAAAVSETNGLLTSRGVNVLFFNPQTESPVTQNLQTLARQANVPIVDVGETLPPGTDYLGWLSGLRAQIATAVGAPQ